MGVSACLLKVLGEAVYVGLMCNLRCHPAATCMPSAYERAPALRNNPTHLLCFELGLPLRLKAGDRSFVTLLDRGELLLEHRGVGVGLWRHTKQDQAGRGTQVNYSSPWASKRHTL